MPATVVLIDLFCGVGGYSEGALRSGVKHVVAVDYWNDALIVHKALHGNNVTPVYFKLGGDMKSTYEAIKVAIPMKFKKAKLVCHASPPCQDISLAKQDKSVSDGLKLVKWSLKFMSTYFDKWTFEQVNHPKVKELLKKFTPYYEVVDMSDYGVPQTRRRLIASNYDVFKCMDSHLADVSLPQVITPPRGTAYITGSYFFRKRILDGDLRDTRKYTPTVKAYTFTSAGARFLDASRKEIRPFTTEELAKIQTFSKYSSYILSNIKQTLAKKVIANSVPPQFASVLVSCLLTTRSSKIT